MIQRDQPVFTVEVLVHYSPARTKELLRTIASLGYDSYLVEEVHQTWALTRAPSQTLHGFRLCFSKGRWFGSHSVGDWNARRHSQPHQLPTLSRNRV